MSCFGVAGPDQGLYFEYRVLSAVCARAMQCLVSGSVRNIPVTVVQPRPGDMVPVRGGVASSFCQSLELLGARACG